jgi:hypothetical protein
VRAVTAAFDTAVRDSHTTAIEAVVIDGDGNETPIDVVDGTVTLDQTAAVRGRCDITIVDDGTLDLVPDSASSLLAPYGNEIRLARGVTYPDGTTELVSLGVFRIQDAEITDAAGGMEIRVAGLDRAQRVIDARFEEPYNVAAGTNYATAILDVIQAAYPDVEYDLTTTALTTPALIAEEGGDRWQFAQDMATAIAMRLYFDGDGVLRLVPSVLSESVAEIVEGEGGVLVEAGRRWTREGTFNRVIATGENTTETAPARGVATDDNPLSPTYYFGRFGKVPRFFPSPFITTDAQAESAAQKILDDELGTSEQVSFGSLVLPHLEPGDTVRVTRARAGIDEEHIVDAIAVPLGPTGVLSGQTRARQVLS